MASAPLTRFSFEEYLRLEEVSEHKNEFDSGQIYAMAGGTEVHANLCSEMVFLLRSYLGVRCRVYGSDLKVYSTSHDQCVYPDAMVICGPPEFYKNRTDIVTNPTLLVEVLSPSTELYDRHGKSALYRTIPSVRECLLVAQDHIHVMHLSRQTDDTWTLTDLNAPEAIADLRTVGISIPLSEIYRGMLPV